MLDLVVEGNACLDGKLTKCCIGIDDGKIVAIKKILKGDQHFDFGDKLIMPAGIDIHVHFRDPGLTDKEDFSTGTLAAGFGGISCIMDMPNTVPPVLSRNGVLEKLEIVSKKTHIDFGLYSSITEKTKVPETADVCSAFKIYLASTTGELLFSRDKLLAPILKQINASHRVPAIHAESEKIIKKLLKDANPPKNLHEHYRSRPNEAEIRAISRVLDVAKGWDSKNSKNLLKELTNQKYQNLQTKPQTKRLQITKNENVDDTQVTKSVDKQIHICHVSTAEAVELLRSYRVEHANNNKKLVRITTEVTPHHLLLNENFKDGAFGKVNPPLRRTEDQAALWSALADGTIDVLASDHAPHTLEEKSERFNLAPSGLPGVETMLPLMMAHVKHNRLSLARLVSAISTIPAQIFGLPKGRLAVGYDGDLAVLDFYQEIPIKVKNLHSKCGWTPFEKMDAIFPILTIVRGHVVVKDGNQEIGPGLGKYYN